MNRSTLVDLGEGKEQKQSLTVKFECLDIDEHLLSTAGAESCFRRTLPRNFLVMWEA